MLTAGAPACCSTMSSKEGFDGFRFSKMSLFGTFIFAPSAHIWYGRVLAKAVPGAATGGAVAKKVAMDQVFYGPFLNATFLSYLESMDGGENIMGRLQEQMIPVSKANLMFWPFWQALNFKFVPVPYQVCSLPLRSACLLLAACTLGSPARTQACCLLLAPLLTSPARAPGAIRCWARTLAASFGPRSCRSRRCNPSSPPSPRRTNEERSCRTARCAGRGWC